MSDAENVARWSYETTRDADMPPWGLLSVTDWPRKDSLVLSARQQLDRGDIPAPTRIWRP